MSTGTARSLHKQLERLYAACNRRELVEPDPLAVVLRYEDAADRELVGLIASSLAYGNVRQIVRSVEEAVAPLGPSPADWLRHRTPASIGRCFRCFKHRWSTGDELVDLLWSVRRINREYGSLLDCFMEGYRDEDSDVLPGLQAFVAVLRRESRLPRNSLLSEPGRGSACKRLLLFLKWMVRYDDVDPGCWRHAVRAARLVVPVDTHMHRMGRAFGLTKRKQANMAAALDITEGFRTLEPDDPVKYDFVLTRIGMRHDIDRRLIPLGSYEEILARAV